MKWLLSAALPILILLPQDDAARQARELIDQLRTGDIAAREAATRKLAALGESARPELAKAAKDSDAALARAAGRLIDRLELLKSLPPRLLKHRPEIADRLAFGGDNAWTEEFLEAEKLRTPSGSLPLLTRAEIEPLAARAIRGAADKDEKWSVALHLWDRMIRSVDVELARLFDDPDESVRDAALEALSPTPPDPVRRRICELIGHESTPVRVFALQAVAGHRIAEALPEVLKALKDSDGEIRAQAIKTLGYLGARETREEAVRALDDPSPATRSEAVRALKRICAKGEGARLAKRLADEDEDVAEAAFEALADLGCRESIPAIAAQLSNKDEDLRWEAVRALRLLSAKEETVSVMALQSDKDAWVRRGVLDFLVEVDPAKARIEALKGLKDPNETVRQYSMEVLGRLGDAGDVPALLECLKDADANARSEAARALGKLRAASAVDALEKMAETGEVRERMAAMLSLARLDSRKSIPKIVANFGHKEGFVRRMAVASLSVMRAKEQVKEIAALLKDPESAVRGSAVRALASILGKDSLPFILPLLDDKDLTAREQVLWALVQLEAWEAAPRVIPLLEDTDRSCRRAAETYLAHAGIADGVPLTFLEGWGPLTSLNALRRRDLWKRLRALPAPQNLKGTVLEVFQALAKTAGLAVELEPDPVSDDEKWLHRKYWEEEPDKGVSVAIAVERLVPLVYDAILENDRIRLVPHETAVRFWRDWWKEFSASPKK